jgi:hypothetical protein
VGCFQRLETYVPGGDDFILTGFPDKSLGIVGIVFLDEAVDCSLQIDQQMEHTVLAPVTRQFGEEDLSHSKGC